jgi:hypothetical protein
MALLSYLLGKCPKIKRFNYEIRIDRGRSAILFNTPAVQHRPYGTGHLDREIRAEFTDVIVLNDILGTVRICVLLKGMTAEGEEHLVKLILIEPLVAVLVNDVLAVESGSTLLERFILGFAKTQQNRRECIARQLEHALVHFPILDDVTNIAGADAE